MLDFNTENTGARVVINPAPFKAAKDLKKALFKQIRENAVGIKLKSNADNLLQKDIDFTGCIEFLKNALIDIDISEDVEGAIFECLKYCTYMTTHKITAELFDIIPEAREDYYEIIISCVEENLRPFIKSLVSKWKTLAPKLGKNQALYALLAEMKV